MKLTVKRTILSFCVLLLAGLLHAAYIHADSIDNATENPVNTPGVAPLAPVLTILNVTTDPALYISN